MNAKFTMRMALAGSVLMAVSQSTTMAGGHIGGGGGSFHSMPSTPVRSLQQNFTASNFKVQTQAIKPVQTLSTRNLNLNTNQGLKLITKNPQLNVTQIPVNGIQPTGGTNPTGGTKFPGNGLRVPVNGVVVLPPTGGTGGGSNPTGTKFPGSGLRVPVDGVVFQPTGGGSTPPSGGTGTPPSGGSMPPSGSNNWWGYGPAFYGNWGYGYGAGSYGASSASPVVYNNVPASGPALVDTAAAPLATSATAADKLTLKLGQSYTIVNDHFGDQAGDLSVAIGGVRLPVRVDKWDAEQITFTLPSAGLDKATDGLFNVAGPDHKLTKAVPVVLVAAQ